MSEVRTLAVIGAGNMGSGIAQKMATEGFRVLLVDLNEAQIDRGIGIIRKTLEEGVARRIFKEWQVFEILGRVRKTVGLGRARRRPISIVEAVFEDLDVKRDVFARLGKVAKPDAILATNTSSFYVRDLAEAATHPERVLGLHYFYHPAKNRLVEIIPTRETSKAAIARAQAIQDALGKTAIVCADAPGLHRQPVLRAVAERGGAPARREGRGHPDDRGRREGGVRRRHGAVRADERHRDPDRAPRRDDARPGARPLLRARAAARGAGEARAALEARRDARRRAASRRSRRACSA